MWRPANWVRERTLRGRVPSRLARCCVGLLVNAWLDVAKTKSSVGFYRSRSVLATEIISHALQAWAEGANSDESLVLVDFANAYNSLDRQKMLESIAADAPDFLPYANFCYGAATPLRGRDFLLWSEEGTQQGDCCGPIFFSVTLQQLVRACCPTSDEAWSRWFLDDGTLRGKTRAVETMFGDLVHKSPEYELKVNVEKCKQWGPVPSRTAVAPCVPWDSGVKVLGIPVGSPGFVTEYSRKVLSKLQACLERLKLLGCAFSAFHILRSCLSACKVIHLLRTLPFIPSEVGNRGPGETAFGLG